MKTLIRQADTQADLSLRWAHIHFVGFAMRRLICFPFLSCYKLLDGVFGVCVPFPFNVSGGMWNSILLSPYKQFYCLLATF